MVQYTRVFIISDNIPWMSSDFDFKFDPHGLRFSILVCANFERL
jgi:hypothetical protein